MSGSFTYRDDCEEELARDAGMVRVIETYCIAGAEAAEKAAPRGAHRGHHYADTIDHVVGIDAAGVVGSVYSTDPFAHLVEFGSKNNEPYSPLRRGVEAVGLRVTDRRRGG